MVRRDIGVVQHERVVGRTANRDRRVRGSELHHRHRLGHSGNPTAEAQIDKIAQFIGDANDITIGQWPLGDAIPIKEQAIGRVFVFDDITPGLLLKLRVVARNRRRRDDNRIVGRPPNGDD